MTITDAHRRQLTEAELKAIAGRFRLLGTVSRLRILNALMPGPLLMTDLSERTSLGQSNLSRHVAALENARCVRRTREGREVRVAIVDPALFALCELVCGSLAEDAQRRHRELSLTASFEKRRQANRVSEPASAMSPRAPAVPRTSMPPGPPATDASGEPPAAPAPLVAPTDSASASPTASRTDAASTSLSDSASPTVSVTGGTQPASAGRGARRPRPGRGRRFTPPGRLR